MRIKLYSTFHKPFYKPEANFVIPIQAGKIIAPHKLTMPGDDTEENISDLNPFFSELTPLYWIIKNADRNACEAWGLCHYRRYFMTEKDAFFNRKKSDYTFKQSPQKINETINQKLYIKIQQLLTENAAIVQLPKYIHKKRGEIRTLEENYLNKHIAQHWEILRTVLLEKYPLYESSWAVFCQSTKMSFYNMMIAKWELWDEYTNWLFDILFEVHKKINTKPEGYQERAVAFMAERLLNLFLMHNKIKTGYLPIAIFDKPE